MMKKMKNNLDERQELTLLKVEHVGCWLAYWGLLAAIFLQMAFGGFSLRSIGGEWCVFMCLSLYLAAACIKNGIWDRKLKPNFRTNLVVSGIAAAVTGLLYFVISYRNFHNLIGSIATGIFMFLLVGVACVTLLTGLSKVYKKRLQRMEESQEDDC
ncbi:MAG: hypothetical protein Q4D55_04860 [Eubacteriales bacterium]|nr:hypothetical protein [Eubacteriales bacterium]